MPVIYQRLFIATSSEIVFEALTTQQGLSGWWTTQVQAIPEKGSLLRFHFGPDYSKEMKLASVVPHQAISWDCIGGAEEWIGTTISFQLDNVDTGSPDNPYPEMDDQLHQAGSAIGTILVLRHDNWKDETPMYGECSYTWGRFMRSLKLFCETGKGTPWPTQHQIVPQ